MGDIKARIAARAAKEFKDGDTANLGIGLPTMVSNFLPEGVDIILHSENGFIGLGPNAVGDERHYEIINSGGNWVTVKPFVNYFGTDESFAIIRGGHVDATVLGAMQVDEKGNLANWIVPGKSVAGMGGAMDLVVGAKKVIIAMTHTQVNKKTGAVSLKILDKCTLPLTAEKCVDMIITEMGVFEYKDGKMYLTERYEDYTLEQIAEATSAHYIVADDLKVNPAE